MRLRFQSPAITRTHRHGPRLINVSFDIYIFFHFSLLSWCFVHCALYLGLSSCRLSVHVVVCGYVWRVVVWLKVEVWSCTFPPFSFHTLVPNPRIFHYSLIFLWQITSLCTPYLFQCIVLYSSLSTNVFKTFIYFFRMTVEFRHDVIK